jgi:Domain of unknown function (DUF4331)
MNSHSLKSALLLGALLPTLAFASSHREAPVIALDPAADNTDLWAWVKPGTHDKLYIVAAYNPLEEPSGGPNFHSFSDDVLYEIHVARGASSLEDVVTYQIRFRTQSVQAGGGFPIQTYTVTKRENGQSTVIARDVRVVPPNIGPRTYGLVTKGQYGATSAAYDDAFAAGFVTPMGNSGSEGTVWAGPRDDGFYVDLGGVFDLAGLRAAGAAQDGVAGFARDSHHRADRQRAGAWKHARQRDHPRHLGVGQPPAGAGAAPQRRE